MSEVIYKIRVNRPCRLFIDEEEVMTLEESKLTKITLPVGEYLLKVVAEDESTVFKEKVISLFHPTVDDIALDAVSLEEEKRNALPKEIFQGNLYFHPTRDKLSVRVVDTNKDVDTINIPDQIKYAGYVYPVTEVQIIERDIKSITIPSGVKSIWLKDCSLLTSVVISSGATCIGDRTFEGCYSLRSITIPESVTEIGSLAFKGCSSLTAIDYAGTKEQWENIEKGYRLIESEWCGKILGDYWNDESKIKVIRCKDGEIEVEGKLGR